MEIDIPPRRTVDTEKRVVPNHVQIVWSDSVRERGQFVLTLKHLILFLVIEVVCLFPVDLRDMSKRFSSELSENVC